MSERKGWLDVAGVILVPILIAIMGAFYTRSQAASDEKRLHLDRDIGYLKLLASEKPAEQQLGLVVIAQRKRAGDFSEDLKAMLTELAAGEPDSKTTVSAQRILGQGRQEVASTKGPSDQTPIYIQYGKKEQQSKASLLQGALQKDGFEVKQLIQARPPLITQNTYVRFFQGSSASRAAAVNELMLKQGYLSSTVQDFSAYAYTDKPLPFIEIWIGMKDQNGVSPKRDQPDITTGR